MRGESNRTSGHIAVPERGPAAAEAPGGDREAFRAEILAAGMTRHARAEQKLLDRRFAAVERAAVRAGLAFALVAVALYFTGAVEPLVPIDRLMRAWGADAEAFRAATGLPGGWGWMQHLNRSDMLSLASLAFLGSVQGFTYLTLLPLLWRRRDWIYLGLAAAQVLVFVVAATGWLTGG